MVVEDDDYDDDDWVNNEDYDDYDDNDEVTILENVVRIRAAK